MGEKMYYVYKSISESEQPISAKKIHEYLKGRGLHLDIKTVYSLIARINDFYYSLTGKQLIKVIRKKGYIIENEFFDDGQLQFLFDSVIFNPNLNDVAVVEMLGKLASLSSFNQIKRLNIEKSNKKRLNYNLLLSLTTIIKAINNKKCIAFKYINYDLVDDHITEVYHDNGNCGRETYVVSPYKLILRGANYYLVGYYNKRVNSLSVYRVDRMRLLRNNNNKFEDIRDQFDMKKIFKKNVNMYFSNNLIDLKIRFDQNILKEVVNQFGKDIIFNKGSDGKVEAEIKNVALSNGLIGWLLMLQTNIQVLAPLNLKEIIKERLESMLRLYEQETE